MIWLSVTDPRTATTVTRDYPDLAAAMEAAAEAENDGAYVVIEEDSAGTVLRDTRPAEWIAALDPA